MAIIKPLSENYIMVIGPDIVGISKDILRKFLLYSENFPVFQLLFGLPDKCLFYKGLTCTQQTSAVCVMFYFLKYWIGYMGVHCNIL